ATNTERRIRFTPEIPGPRVAEARPEWEIPCLVARAARGEVARRALPYAHPREIRHEMAGVMPLYAGIETLEHAGQSIQSRAPQPIKRGFTKRPHGRARFSLVEPHRIEIPQGRFYLTTRRGKQFNSMTIGRHDALMGVSRRDEVLMAATDAERLGLRDGDPLR